MSTYTLHLHFDENPEVGEQLQALREAVRHAQNLIRYVAHDPTHPEFNKGASDALAKLAFWKTLE